MIETTKNIVSCGVWILLFSCQQDAGPTANRIANPGKSAEKQEVQNMPMDQQTADFSKTFAGTINGNLEVVFQLEHKQGKVHGIYFYKDQGIDIQLEGTLAHGKLVLFEQDFQSQKAAEMVLVMDGNQCSGTWKKSGAGKELPVKLKEINERIPELPGKITGTYHNDESTQCPLKLTITALENGLFYKLTTAERVLKGKVTFVRSLEEGKNYIVLGGITWAENEGDISNERAEDATDAVEKQHELPVGIEGLLSPGEIIIQNYGNAMNYYVKLADCGDKYIHLRN